MLAVYIGALIVGAGILVVQLAMGHHGGDAHDTANDHDAHDTPLGFLASLRFWSFALLAFGMSGVLLSVFALAEAWLAAAIASTVGVASGFGAVTAVRRLTAKSASSHAGARDVVGHVGRVIVPPNDRGALKVRVDVKGSQIDFVARTTEPLGEGDTVLVEEMEGAQLLVSRAPRDLDP